MQAEAVESIIHANANSLLHDDQQMTVQNDGFSLNKNLQADAHGTFGRPRPIGRIPGNIARCSPG